MADESSGLMPLVQALHKALGIEGWSTEQAAAQNLANQPGGSIMANYSAPTPMSEFLKSNPLLATVLDVANIFKPSPLDAAGGGSQAALGPIRTQAQKQAVKAIFRHDPETLKAVVDDPRMLQILTPTTKGGPGAVQALGLTPESLANYGDSATLPLGRIAVQPTTFRGQTPSGGVDMLANLPQVMGHEATHFLNSPRLYKQPMAPADVSNMYNQIAPFIGPHARTAAREGAQAANDPRVGLDEAMAYLTGKTTRADSGGIGEALANLLRGGRNAPALTPEFIGESVFKAKNMALANHNAEIEALIKRLQER